MKKIILAFFFVFLSWHAYSQGRLMYVQKENGIRFYEIGNKNFLHVILANGQKHHGYVRLLNDTLFSIGNDTIHIDSVVKITRIKHGRVIPGNIVLSLGISLMKIGSLDVNDPKFSLNYYFSRILITIGVLAVPASIIMITPASHRINGKDKKLIIKTFPKITKTNSRT